jgi:hypothetical protein
MERIVVSLWWDGPGRYLMSDGMQERHLGFCRYVEEIVAALRRETDLDLHSTVIIREDEQEAQ